MKYTALMNHVTAAHTLLMEHITAGNTQAACDTATALLASHPDQGQLWHLYGFAMLQGGRNADAHRALRRATELLPDNAEMWEHLGLAQSRLLQHSAADASFARSVALDPAAHSAWSNAAKNAVDAGKYAHALHYAGKAAQLDPASLAAHCNMGNALARLQRSAEAETCYRRALALAPDSAEVHHSLGSALMNVDRDHEAATHFEQALALQPGHAHTHNMLGAVLMKLGRHDMAIASYRRALALKPDCPRWHTELLFCLTHDAGTPPAVAFDAHTAFSARFELPLVAGWPAHTNLRDPHRRLRVGFVSGDMFQHVVSYFIAPVWAQLDRNRVEVLVYSTNARRDGTTATLEALADQWLQVEGLDDEALAARIQADRIDVLIDLSGHTAHNRLLVFARKPAPVQATWIGYPNTTGLRAMDYVLCDGYNAPRGLYEHHYSEQFARLPSSGTFTPPPGSPEVNLLPALGGHGVTFGSFNRAAKLGQDVIATWSAVLHAVPGARLLLCDTGDPAQAQRLASAFGSHGIAAERLLFRPRVPMQDYLRLHHEVDIVLDTWPYTGGTTTNLALWMGVPVVTLQGPARAHCQSAAVLGRMGMQEWVAHDRAGFVQIAVRWARSPYQLASLRAGLRARWANAPLRQPATVARGLELALRTMWQRWCDGLPAAHFEVAPEQLQSHE